MNFHYTVLNEENKKLTGNIEAISEEEARGKLNTFGFSVIKISTDSKTSSGKSTKNKFSLPQFQFEGLDSNGHTVVGTIEEETDAVAYQKLREDYNLTITNLFEEDSNEEKKADAKLRLDSIVDLYEKEIGQKQENVERRIEEQKLEESEVTETVKKTIMLVQGFLTKYEVDMKPNQRKELQEQLNQLLRIKDSTNFNHLRRTCELTLDYVEKQEIFMQKQKRIKEQTYLKTHSHELLEHLQKHGLKTEISLIPLFNKMAKSSFFASLGNFFLNITHTDDPNIYATKKQITDVSHKIWETRKMHFKEKDAAYKHELDEEIARLRTEKKRLKKTLKALINEKRDKLRSEVLSQNLNTWKMWRLIVGWLLVFYMMLYFISFPLIFKDTGINIPDFLHIYKSGFIKFLITLIFFVHGAIGLKNYFLPARIVTNMLIMPAATIIYLFFLFNIIL
jgi:hypothetical protein